MTRERPKTDRIACPWLIRRFIDPEAEFLYVPAGEVLAVAEREDALSYDAPGARYTHRDGLCSFEVLVEEYAIADPAVACSRGSCTGRTSPRTWTRLRSRRGCAPSPRASRTSSRTTTGSSSWSSRSTTRSATQVGVVLACLLAGAALVSVLLARYGDRAGRRRSYCLLLVVMGGAGAVFSLTTWTPALALAARLYNTVATLAGSLGALSAVVAGSQRWLLAYPAAAALGLLAAVRLSPRVEVGSELEPRPRSPLHRSRGTVLRLSSLFALDSFGGGLGVPFVIAGALKSLYDLGLWAIFRQVDPKTESAAAA